MAGIRFLANEHGLIAEGSCATAVAPLLSGQITPGDGPTVVVLTGRNIATSSFIEALTHA
jgi:threonine dehydratase